MANNRKDRAERRRQLFLKKFLKEHFEVRESVDGTVTMIEKATGNSCTFCDWEPTAAEIAAGVDLAT